MGNLFDRVAEFLYGDPANIDTKLVGLRMNFKIKKNSGLLGNTCKVLIYNVNKDTEADILESEKLTGVLQVGYGTDVDTIFSGNFTRKKIIFQGTDKIAEIDLSDGNEALKKTIFLKSYEKNIKFSTILSDIESLIKDKANALITTFKGLDDKPVLNGITFNGDVEKALRKIIGEQSGLEASFQNNSLQIIKREETVDSDPVFLSPETGLVGSPVPTKNGGLEAIALIIPGLDPGKLTVMESRNYSGNYKILTAEITGDNFEGNKWFNKMNLIPV